MKTIHMIDEKDVRQEVNDTLSCAYEGRDWCEDGSVRQDIKDLRSNVVDIDDDIDKLKLHIDNSLSVSANHEHYMQKHSVEITKLNQKIDVLVKSIAEIDSLETLKKKLDVLNIKGDNGWMQN